MKSSIEFDAVIIGAGVVGLAIANEEPKDFVIKNEIDLGFPNLINLIGFESPGLTSSLAIGNYVKRIIISNF